MEIKKFIKTNRLFLSALLLLLVIITILLSLRNPSVSYKIGPEKIAALLNDSANQVSPLLIFNQVSKGDKSLVLVDVRSSDEFAKGNIANSINIPIRELLQKRSLSLFKELKKTSATAVLYGEDQLQANGPWMLLKQVGFDNIRVMQGGYSFYKTLPLPDSLIQSKMALWNVELPAIDTAGFKKARSMANATAVPVKTETKTEKVIPAKKKGSTGGGC